VHRLDRIGLGFCGERAECEDSHHEPFRLPHFPLLPSYGSGNDRFGALHARRSKLKASVNNALLGADGCWSVALLAFGLIVSIRIVVPVLVQ
jgi:hypothetical protein